MENNDAKEERLATWIRCRRAEDAEGVVQSVAGAVAVPVKYATDGMTDEDSAGPLRSLERIYFIGGKTQAAGDDAIGDCTYCQVVEVEEQEDSEGLRCLQRLEFINVAAQDSKSSHFAARYSHAAVLLRAPVRLSHGGKSTMAHADTPAQATAWYVYAFGGEPCSSQHRDGDSLSLSDCARLRVKEADGSCVAANRLVWEEVPRRQQFQDAEINYYPNGQDIEEGEAPTPENDNQNCETNRGDMGSGSDGFVSGALWPCARRGVAGVAISETEMFIFGGKANGGRDLGDGHCFETMSGLWEQPAFTGEVPTVRCHALMSVIPGSIASPLAEKSPEEVEAERRLLYVPSDEEIAGLEEESIIAALSDYFGIAVEKGTKMKALQDQLRSLAHARKEEIESGANFGWKGYPVGASLCRLVVCGGMTADLSTDDTSVFVLQVSSASRQRRAWSWSRILCGPSKIAPTRRVWSGMCFARVMMSNREVALKEKRTRDEIDSAYAEIPSHDDVIEMDHDEIVRLLEKHCGYEAPAKKAPKLEVLRKQLLEFVQSEEQKKAAEIQAAEEAVGSASAGVRSHFPGSVCLFSVGAAHRGSHR